jgi:protein tyrosine/serine phosphatase
MKIYQMRKYHLPLSRRYIALLFATMLAAVQVVQVLANGAQDSQALPISIENFGKLNNNYYRGSQPTAGQFDELKKLGIKTIIDLRKDSIEGASQEARDAGLQYVNIPLTTKRPATQDQTAQFLKLVNDPANWPVFVHCKGGRHRTGEMTAIYRITHEGWSGDQAYEEMKKYDFEDSFFYPRSLKKYVFSYYERLRSMKTTYAEAVETTPAVP